MLRRALRTVAILFLLAGVLWIMMPFLLNSLLYFPSRHFFLEPTALGLHPTDVAFDTEDGEQLHGWWFRTEEESLGQVLLFHGNAGNIGDRLLHARLLTGAGLDVFSFDYRGYGRSTGSPDEEGTYRDARAARRALLRQEGADDDRVFYLGESLGGGVAVALAREAPPRGLILLSTFTSVRDMGRVHYPIIPTPLVPDAYPSLRRIRDLKCPLLVMHGDRDEIVPVKQGRALYEAAPGPKRLHLFPGAGHNDLLDRVGREWAETIAGWVGEVVESGC
jgi:pimeloyl-ACP methyl ester carboxylesterase